MAKNALQLRVTRRLNQLGRSPLEAAKTGDLERNYIDDLINDRKRSISQNNLGKVAKGLDWTISELLGQGSVNARTTEFTTINSGIPEIDVRGGASYGGGFGQEEATVGEGGALVSRDAVRATWGIPLPFLRDELRVRPERVHILPVRGDSMNDALFDGDRVIIDLDDTQIGQGGIFALLDGDGGVIIKQVEVIRGAEGRRIRCKSRNPNYEPFELTLDDPVKVLGRVACKITRL